MSLIQDYQDIIGEFKDNQDYFQKNTALYEVHEGNILPHILKALSKQFSNNTFEQMTHRVPPINIMRRIVDKLSRIYQPGPTRSVLDGQDRDNELLSWYDKCFKTNNKMNLSNEYFNLFKNTLLHVCLIDGKPNIRPIPSERFLVLGKDPLNPMKVTHVITAQGRMADLRKPDQQSLIFHLYTDDEFLIVQGDKTVRTDLMEMYGNVDGVNPYGKLPFIYTTRSANELIPVPDSDMYNMSLLIPISLTDLNAGLMFQIFSIFYTVGLSPEGLTYAPNAVWNFKVDPGQEGKTEVGILKPQFEVAQGLMLIQSQLTLWLESIGVRPGSMGQLNGDNAASGIAKIIDEVDTSEHRMKQIGFFQDVENDLWDFVINHAHPYWLSTGQLKDQSLSWTPGAQVTVNFAEQIPLQTRGELLKEQIEELNAGLTTKPRVIHKMNPEMTTMEVADLMSDIDAEKALKITLGDFQNDQGNQTEAANQDQF